MRICALSLRSQIMSWWIMLSFYSRFPDIPRRGRNGLPPIFLWLGQRTSSHAEAYAVILILARGKGKDSCSGYYLCSSYDHLAERGVRANPGQRRKAPVCLGINSPSDYNFTREQ